MNEMITHVRTLYRENPKRFLGCVAVVVVLALVLVTAVTRGSSEPSTRNSPLLIKGANVNVGLLTDLPGLSDLDRERTSWTGFQYDLMNRLAIKLALTMTPVPVTFEDREPRIQNGEVKVMLANFSMTDDRCKRVMCIGPYMTSKNSVMTRAGGPRIQKVEEMKGKSVCTMTGTTSLQKLNEQIGGKISIVEEVSLRQCVNGLREGKVTAVATAQIDLLGYAQQDRELRIEDFHFGTEDRFAVALHKDAALQDCETIRDQLREFIAAPEWSGFFAEHFPQEPTTLHRPNKDSIAPCPAK